MKLITYQSSNEPRLGALLNNEVIDLAEATKSAGDSSPFPSDMIAFLAEGDAGLTRAANAITHAETNSNIARQSAQDITFLPPVLNPGKVIALGRNYAAHAAEGGAEPPEYPMLFHKTAGSLLGHRGTVVIPPVTNKVDYECELAVIIGRAGKAIEEEDAFSYVAGYTCANDVSARDWQRRTAQFTAGKMLDTFCPLGPALVTSDEIPDPGNLNIRTILNGQEMQNSNTKMMIFSVPFLIHYISQIITLQVGDVILTGTPEGVGFARKPPVYLKEGDEVTIEVEKVGMLTNSVVEE